MFFRKKEPSETQKAAELERAKKAKRIPYGILDAETFAMTLEKLIPADDLKYRMNAALNFLHNADIARAAKEFPKARALLEQIAAEQKLDPKEVYASGVMTNLGFYWPNHSLRECSIDHIERALLIIEHLGVSGFVVEFFIAFCFEKALPQEEGLATTQHTAHYAQRAAKLRPGGCLTRTEWERIRNRFLAGTCAGAHSDSNNAFKAHAALCGDTTIVFECPE